MLGNSNPLSQYRLSTQPLSLGGLGRALGFPGLAAERRPTGSPGPWEAPGEARPAVRPRPCLAVETGAVGTPSAGQSSLHPGSDARCPAGGCGVVRAAGPASAPAPGTDSSRKPAGASAQPGTAIPGTGPLLPAGRERLNRASVTRGATESPNLSFSRLAQKLF